MLRVANPVWYISTGWFGLKNARMKPDTNRSLTTDFNSDHQTSYVSEASTVGAAGYPSAFISSMAAVLGAGLAGSFLPYILWWHKTGHFVYIADKDNQYYLQLAAQPYYSNLFSMSDPVLPHGVTMYQSLQFIPAALIARILGLSALEINLVWHLWAAIALSLTFYLVFFHWLQRPWASALCAIVMLFDCGVLTVEPLVIQIVRLYQAAVGHLPIMFDGQDLLGQWRIVDPAVASIASVFSQFGRRKTKRSQTPGRRRTIESCVI